VHRNVSFKFAYRYQQFDDSSVSGSAVKLGTSYYSGCDYKCRDNKVSWAGADIDTEIHSIRATLVIGLNPVPQAVVPLK
jgi:hypothetical protein